MLGEHTHTARLYLFALAAEDNWQCFKSAVAAATVFLKVNFPPPYFQDCD